MSPSPSDAPPKAPVPRVSVLMLTYQHERYIAQALDSILAQRVDFPIEVVVCDDASKDGTAAIMQRYAAAHPQIHAIVQPKNLGVHGNLRVALGACRGEYIAFLEGDDYWIGDAKLARQVAYLDAHPEIVATGHRLATVDADGNGRDYFTGPDVEITLDAADAVEQLLLPTNSMLVRAAPLAPAGLPAALWTVWPPDDALRTILAHSGGFHYSPLVEGAYRTTAQGVWSQRPVIERARHRIHFYETLPSFTDARFHPIFVRRLAYWRAVLALELAGAGDRRGALRSLAQAMRSAYVRRTERGLLLRAAFRTAAPGLFARVKTRFRPA